MQLIYNIQNSGSDSLVITKYDIIDIKNFLCNYRDDESPDVFKAKRAIYNFISKLQFVDPTFGTNQILPEWVYRQNPSTSLSCPEELLWTGFLLHLYGNDNLVYLAKGSESVVWADTKKGIVYKVYYNEIEFSEDKKDSTRAKIKRITAIVSANSEKKSALRKYLDLPTSYDHLAIFTSRLALTDYEVTGESEKIILKRGNTLPVSSFISYAKNVVKPLLELHDKKFSHNDLKLENLLFIPKDEKKLKEKYGAPDTIGGGGSIFWDNDHKREVNPYRAVISDFGSLNYLPYEYNKNYESTLSTPTYLAPRDPVWQEISRNSPVPCPPVPYSNEQKAQANMRDTYACGQTLLLLLISFFDSELADDDEDLKDIKRIIHYGSVKQREELKDELWNKYLSKRCNEKNKVMDLLDLIFSMMDVEPSKRPSWQSVLKKLKEIQESNYNGPKFNYESPYDTDEI